MTASFVREEEKTKIISKNWGKINPGKIEECLSAGGYRALRKFIYEMEPEEAIAEMKKSGLLGRGGAGFPTGQKMAAVFSQKEKRRYLICNLDESEPGTYKDRLITDNDPQLLLEGMIISALIIGAQKAYIYINGRYRKQIEILKKALEQSREKNFWGRGILGSCYDLEMEIFEGAGGYICGEETALINSLEGNRGEPKIRPPYPAEKGLFGKPTLIGNAETLANIPWIISRGGEKYARIGSAVSPGTKLFLLSGAVKKPGCLELSTGVTLRDLIFHFGGGMQKGKEFWLAQIGGASGRLALEKDLDQKLDYDAKNEIPPGSGSVLVADKSADVWDLLFSWTDFFQRESCGKCVPCREGTFRLFEIIKRFQDGEISDRDKAAAKDILWTLENSTFCPLGKFAAAATRDAAEKLNAL